MTGRDGSIRLGELPLEDWFVYDRIVELEKKLQEELRGLQRLKEEPQTVFGAVMQKEVQRKIEEK